MGTISLSILRTICQCYPFLSGQGRFATSKLLRRMAPAQRVRARLRNGASLYVDARDFIGRSVYWTGDLDGKITEICRKVLRPGDTFLDIGANYGLVSIYAAKCVGASGRVHAFEPQSELAGLGIGRSAEFNFRQITVHPIALSDADGTATISIRNGNRGVASLNEDCGGVSEQVAVRHAGQYLSTLDLPPVRLMKLDVEGHEDQVLMGMRRFFETSPPAAVLYEANDATDQWWEQTRGKLLLGWGYTIYAVPKCLFRLRLQRLHPGRRQPIHSRDFLAVHDHDIAARLLLVR